jgi:hypothetical protein
LGASRIDDCRSIDRNRPIAIGIRIGMFVRFVSDGRF